MRQNQSPRAGPDVIAVFLPDRSGAANAGDMTMTVDLSVC
jgi:hypothetical protein